MENDNPMQKIRDAEKKAEEIVSEANEKGKQLIAEIITRKENELEAKTKEALKETEKYLRGASDRQNKMVFSAEIAFKEKARKIVNTPRSVVDKAVSFVVNRVINT